MLPKIDEFVEKEDDSEEDEKREEEEPCVGC